MTIAINILKRVSATKKRWKIVFYSIDFTRYFEDIKVSLLKPKRRH